MSRAYNRVTKDIEVRTKNETKYYGSYTEIAKDYGVTNSQISSYLSVCEALNLESNIVVVKWDRPYLDKD